MPTLRRGSRGDDVVALQSALVAAGYEIDVDGIFGAGTEEAVVQFQSDNDLDADGIVGRNTWAALEPYIAAC